jgi:hypothetical protein
VLTDNEILPSQARVFNHCCSEIFVNIRGGSVKIKNSVETNAGMSFRLFVFLSFRLFVFSSFRLFVFSSFRLFVFSVFSKSRALIKSG